MAKPSDTFLPVPGPTLDGQQFAQTLEPVAGGFQVVPAPHTNNLNAMTCKNAAAPANPPVADRRGDSTSEVFVNPAPAPDKTKAILDLIADPNEEPLLQCGLRELSYRDPTHHHDAEA